MHPREKELMPFVGIRRVKPENPKSAQVQAIKKKDHNLHPIHKKNIRFPFHAHQEDEDVRDAPFPLKREVGVWKSRVTERLLGHIRACPEQARPRCSRGVSSTPRQRCQGPSPESLRESYQLQGLAPHENSTRRLLDKVANSMD